MIIVSESIIINKPIKEVFGFVSQLDKGPLWQSGLLSVKVTGTGGSGSRVTTVNQNLGRRFESQSEITQFIPPQLITFRSSNGPIQFEVRYHLEEVGPNQTKFTSRNELDLGVLFNLARPLIEEVAGNKIRTDLISLKELLESPTRAK
jgi:uncharacterized membrane protein